MDMFFVNFGPRYKKYVKKEGHIPMIFPCIFACFLRFIKIRFGRDLVKPWSFFFRTWTKQHLLAWRRNVSSFTWRFHLNTSAVCWTCKICTSLDVGIQKKHIHVYCNFQWFNAPIRSKSEDKNSSCKSRCDIFSCHNSFCKVQCNMWAVCLWKIESDELKNAVERRGLNMFYPVGGEGLCCLDVPLGSKVRISGL